MRKSSAEKINVGIKCGSALLMKLIHVSNGGSEKVLVKRPDGKTFFLVLGFK